MTSDLVVCGYVGTSPGVDEESVSFDRIHRFSSRAVFFDVDFSTFSFHGSEYDCDFFLDRIAFSDFEETSTVCAFFDSLFPAIFFFLVPANNPFDLFHFAVALLRAGDSPHFGDVNL